MKFKLSWLLTFGAIADLVFITLNLYTNKPIGTLFGSFCGMTGWLITQVQLEKLQGETK